VIDDILVDSETFLVTDFVNLKIKPSQSFRDAHKDKMCIRVFIEVSIHIYIYKYLCLYCVFKKRKIRDSGKTERDRVVQLTSSRRAALDSRQRASGSCTALRAGGG
jgi:hypothetical protein